jgi:predicted Zn finger-like uncharacterized protein
VRSDGKIDVFCPQCGAQYRVQEDDLEAKITCTECHRTFFGKAGVGRRAPKDHSKTYLLFGAVAVLIIGSFIALNSRGDKDQPTTTAAPEAQKPAAANLTRNPRIDAVLAWAKNIATKNEFSLRRSTDFPAMQKQLGIGGRDWSLTRGAEREDLEKAVIAALFTSESTRYLRELEANGGSLLSEASLKESTGKARIYATPMFADKNYDSMSNATYEVTFRMEGNEVKVTGTLLTQAPKKK